jgi:hypothetical protein
VLFLLAASTRAWAQGMRSPSPRELEQFPWLTKTASVQPLAERFAPPPVFRRLPVAKGSFGEWLRTLPLRAPGTPVLSWRGDEVRAGGDARVAAVAELDVGRKDLQQCADSIIRLHAEWLRQAGRASEISYRFTSGDAAGWSAYAGGQRAVVRGNKVQWKQQAEPDPSRAAFRRYLDLVFQYAGTISLERDGEKVRPSDVQPGDFLVQGGSPGHAVVILDLAVSEAGEKVALIGQGFTPAQDFHVLSGPQGPWFKLDASDVATPFWSPFPWSGLRRFKVH